MVKSITNNEDVAVFNNIQAHRNVGAVKSVLWFQRCIRGLLNHVAYELCVKQLCKTKVV